MVPSFPALTVASGQLGSKGVRPDLGLLNFFIGQNPFISSTSLIPRLNDLFRALVWLVTLMFLLFPKALMLHVKTGDLETQPWKHAPKDQKVSL